MNAKKVAIEILGRKVMGTAYKVHPELGPGPLESTYERSPAHELMLQE